MGSGCSQNTSYTCTKLSENKLKFIFVKTKTLKRFQNLHVIAEKVDIYFWISVSSSKTILI